MKHKIHTRERLRNICIKGLPLLYLQTLFDKLLLKCGKFIMTSWSRLFFHRLW